MPFFGRKSDQQPSLEYSLAAETGSPVTERFWHPYSASTQEAPCVQRNAMTLKLQGDILADSLAMSYNSVPAAHGYNAQADGAQ